MKEGKTAIPPTVVMMPALSSLLALEVVVMTADGDISDHQVVIMIAFSTSEESSLELKIHIPVINLDKSWPRSNNS